MKRNNSSINVNDAIKAFSFDGEFVDFRPFGNGHINDTYLVRYRLKGKIKKYILQRINHGVFKKPEQVMANVIAVTEFLSKKISEKISGKGNYGRYEIFRRKNRFFRNSGALRQAECRIYHQRNRALPYYL